MARLAKLGKDVYYGIKVARVRRTQRIYVEGLFAYLSQSFENLDGLSRAMAKSCCVLSGSRALEVFIPGSCNEESDWDFYVPFSVYCVGIMMDALGRSGVQWQDVFQPLRDIADAPWGTVVHMELCHVQALITKALTHGPLEHSDDTIDPVVGPILRHIHRELHRRRRCDRIRFGNGTVLLVDHGVPVTRSCSRSSVHVITGFTTHNGVRQKIQLIFQPDLSPMQQITTFYASSAQCGISPFGAFHLFFARAIRHEGIFFPNNSQHVASAHAAMRKHAARGWTFFTPRWVFNTSVRDERLSSSWSSIFVPLRMPVDIPDKLAEARRSMLANLKWEISEGETRLTRAMPISVRHVIEGNRRRRVANRSLRQDPVLREAMALAMRHTVAFNDCSSHLFPDELTEV